jgi:hypothetical protein
MDERRERERGEQIEAVVGLLPECGTTELRVSLLMPLKLPDLREIAKRLGVMQHGGKRDLVMRIARSRRASVGARPGGVNPRPRTDGRPSERGRIPPTSAQH